MPATAAWTLCIEVSLSAAVLIASGITISINAGILLIVFLLLVLPKFTVLRSGGSTEGVELEVLAL